MLRKDNLNIIEVPISKTLIDSCIIYDEVFLSYMRIEYNDVKEKLKPSETFVECAI